VARKNKVRFAERAELLDFLLEVAAATQETLDLDSLLASVAGIVKEVLPAQIFAIMLYSEREKGLRIRYSIGHREEVVKNLIVPLGEGITGIAAKEKQPILVGDVRTDPRYLSVVDAVRTELAVPMLARGKLVGVIDVQSTKLNAFTEYDRTLLRLIASRVAVTIENARLYRRVDRQNRTLKTLSRLSQEFSSILDLDELLQKIASTVRELINYDAFSVLLVDAEAKVLRHRFSIRYDEQVELDNIPLGKGVTGAAAEARLPIRVDDTRNDPRYIASHPAIRSEVAIPLILRDRAVGVMDLESMRIGYYNEDQVRTLLLLAPQIASSVENARLYEELAQREQRMDTDLKAARKVQSVLLPLEAPDLPGLEIGIGLRPAREISGDLYDFFEYGSEHAVIAFGDSSGKGPAAALYGALVSGLLRTMAPRRRGPALLLQSLNEVLLERRVDAQYVTLLILLWHASSRRIIMANAGAIPPMICRSGQIFSPSVEGTPIGLLEDREYDEVAIETEPGDVIALYSDGIHDGPNVEGEEYGDERLAEVLKKTSHLPAKAIVDSIFKDLELFTAGTRMFDDQTIIILKIT
jgi:sigma-B regulation protein RsbU (phosphoserine phosphatase)